MSRPLFDVNVALVLTLRTLVQGGSYSSTTYLDVETNDWAYLMHESTAMIPATDTAVTVIVERVS